MRTDEQLMASYVEHDDQQAFAELYASNLHVVRRLVARHVFRACDAEDIVQQTFMQVHVPRPQYRIGERFRPWLYAIAANLCRDFFRRRQRKPETVLEMDRLAEEPTSEVVVSMEPPPGFAAALENLNEMTR